MSDKERDSIQEMEDIQKGLEAFLQQEMQEMQASGAGAWWRMRGHTLRSVRQPARLRRCMI